MSAPDRFHGIDAPWLEFVPMTVDAHVYPRSVVQASVHAAEGRVVLHVEGTNRVTLHVFAQRAELARLIETATAALAELDTATHTDAASAA